MQNCRTFLTAYKDILEKGTKVSPRGLECLELLNYRFVIDPRYPITSFEDRNLNLDYAKKEVLWYLNGDRFDTSICDAAGAWNTLIQPDGGINSNYGQVIFKGPKLFDWVVEELKRDSHSRRAVMIIGEAAMLNANNNDHRCTMYISYMIREGYLHQTVHMRSNDIIFGMTNDIFFFGLLHQMVWATLRDYYPTLGLGKYTHDTDSLHVYKRHFGMIKKIVSKGVCGWYKVNVPVMYSGDCVRQLLENDINPDNCVMSWLHSGGVK